MIFDDEEDLEDAPTFRLLLKKIEGKIVIVNVIKKDWPPQEARREELEEENDVVSYNSLHFFVK